MTYLQNLVASQYEAIDGMQAFGLPVVYGQLLCSTPECEGGVNASLYGTYLCKKKFEKCRSIKGILNFIHTFVEKGLCQKVNNKDIPILLGNVRACDRTEEFVNDCKANGKHWFCRKSDSLEQDTAGALLDAYFELAVALGNQTILLEAAGGKDGKAILQHVRRENISLELSSLYHIQFWANLVANITAICARIMIQLLNCSNAVAEFCSVAGLDQSGVPSFAEIFCKRALPARYDIGTAVAKSILAKAGAHKIGEQEDVAAILETWFNINIDNPYPPGEQKEDPVAHIMSFIKPMRKKRVATQKESIAILETWFNINIDNPYPPGKQKEDPVAHIMSFIKSCSKNRQTYAEGRGKNTITQQVRDKNDQNLQQQQQQLQQKTYTVKVPEGIGPNMPFDVIVGGQRLMITCPSNAQAGMIVYFQHKELYETTHPTHPTPHPIKPHTFTVTQRNKILKNGAYRLTDESKLSGWKRQQYKSATINYKFIAPNAKGFRSMPEIHKYGVDKGWIVPAT